VWTEGGFSLALFQGWGVRSEVLLEQMQLILSFRNNFIIFLPCELLVDKKYLQKCAFLKVRMATLIMVVMKTEMRIFSNNKIKGN